MAVGVAFAVLVFLLGASVGSFLNVVIYRLPLGISLVRPSSHCPGCKTLIKPWHNIPVFGWLIVRGRCATCDTSLSLRYPLVELAVGLLALAIFHDFAGGLIEPEILIHDDFILDVLTPFVLYLVFVGGLVAITFIDLDHFIIPNEISLPAIPLGIIASVATGHVMDLSWQDALVGAAAGGGFLLAISMGYGALTGREGIGGGDVKLLAALGAWLGWQAIPAILLLSSLTGIAFALLLRRAFAVETLPPDPMASASEHAETVDEATEGPKSFGQLAIPFGPFLCLAAIEYLLFRRELQALMTEYLTLGS